MLGAQYPDGVMERESEFQKNNSVGLDKYYNKKGQLILKVQFQRNGNRALTIHYSENNSWGQ